MPIAVRIDSRRSDIIKCIEAMDYESGNQHVVCLNYVYPVMTSSNIAPSIQKYAKETRLHELRSDARLMATLSPEQTPTQDGEAGFKSRVSFPKLRGTFRSFL